MDTIRGQVVGSYIKDAHRVLHRVTMYGSSKNSGALIGLKIDPK